MIRRLRSNWQDAVLVCGKCSRKVGGGFGADGRTSLAKTLRRASKLGKGRKASTGIVETKCLGICPKRAVAVARAGSWLVVPVGTNVELVAAELGLGAGQLCEAV